MADRSQRTEKATPQRIRKAREKGQFPQSREFVAAIQFAVVIALLGPATAAWMEAQHAGMRALLAQAFTAELTPQSLALLARRGLTAGFGPLVMMGGALLGVTLLAQLISTNMGFSLGRLAPSFARMNPLARLREIPRQNLPSAAQAAVLLGLMSYFIWSIVDEQLPQFLRMPFMDLGAGMRLAAASVSQLLWRIAALVVVFGAIEFLRQRWLYHSDLAMTRQEVREEHKESEGDPQIKARIRRLRRDLLRRRMMQEVPTATAVIVNPTHYAVAIRYEHEKMASPVVVAKGRNYIAAKIRQIAIENGVAIVENPPLARALFDAVEIGREIPPDFYRAVAEVLAYVYRLTGMRSR